MRRRAWIPAIGERVFVRISRGRGKAGVTCAGRVTAMGVRKRLITVELDREQFGMKTVSAHFSRLMPVESIHEKENRKA